MPAALGTPIAQPTLANVTDVLILFDAENVNASVTVQLTDSNGKVVYQQYQVPADSTFLALAAATGTRKQRLYNVVLPLCSITPGAIT